MAFPLFQVDAFTNVALGGNPAAICLLPQWQDEHWMQAVAAEMNLAETAFLVARGADWELRWFTPVVEVDLCGHATLASAHALWEAGNLAKSEAARFHTKSGLLTCTRTGDWIEMDFPATPAAACEAPPGLLEALGIRAEWVGRSAFDYVVVCKSLEGLNPDFFALAKTETRGVIVTAASTGEADFVSRFFAPAAGINEDPVTGSAHCCLASLWGERLGKTEMIGHQVSKRGGVVKVRLNGDRVILGGQAVTVMRGELL